MYQSNAHCIKFSKFFFLFLLFCFQFSVYSLNFSLPVALSIFHSPQPFTEFSLLKPFQKFQNNPFLLPNEFVQLKVACNFLQLSCCILKCIGLICVWYVCVQGLMYDSVCIYNCASSPDGKSLMCQTNPFSIVCCVCPLSRLLF